MTIDLIGVDSLPNAYIEKVRVYENNLQTTVLCDIIAFDFSSENASVWYNHRMFKDFMYFNLCFVNDSVNMESENSLISQINEGLALLPNKILRSTRSSLNMASSPFVNNQKSINSHYSVSEYYDAQKTQYRYSIAITTKEKLKNTSAVYVYASLDVEAIENKYDIDLSVDGVKSINGPIACEVIKHNNQIQTSSQVYMIENTDEVWTGPVHSHTNEAGEVRLMAGEQHDESISQPMLMAMTIENSKIFYYSRLNIKERQNELFKTDGIENRNLKNKLRFMSQKYNFPYCYEMDSSFDSEGNLHKMFILDLCNMVLSRSYVARRIFENNVELFMEIGKTLSLDFISIVRRKKGSRRESILASYNNDDKDVIPEIDFYMDSNRNLLTENREEYRHVSFLKQMQAGLPEQLLSLYFTDYEADNLKSGIYGYRFKTEIKDKYYDFVEEILRDLDTAISTISSLHESYTTGMQFDTNSNSVKKEFLVSYFSDYGIAIDEIHGNINPTSDSEDLLTENPIVRAMDHISEAFDLLNIELDVNNFLNKINPITATPESLGMAIKDLQIINNLIESRYRIKYRKLKNTQGVGMGSRSAQRKNIIILEKNLEYEKLKNDIDIGYKFLNFNKSKRMFKLQKRDLVARANYEVSRYFSAPPTNSNILTGVATSVRSNMNNIAANKMMYFTPHKIKMGNNELDTELANTNKQFQTLMIARQVRNIQQKPQLALNLNLLNLPDSEPEEYIDATDLVGFLSPFANKTVDLLKNRKLSSLEKSEDLDDIASVVFSTLKSISNKSVSFGIRAFNPEHEDCEIIDRLRAGSLNPKRIPVQIKSLILSKAATARNNYIKNDKDIFDNHETNEMAKQKFTNIKKLNYLDGFARMENGLYNMLKPIYKDMDDNNYNAIGGMSKICKMNTYTDSSLKLFEEEDDFNTLGSFFVLEDDLYKEPKSFSMMRKSKSKMVSKKIVNSSKNSQNIFSSTIKVKNNKRALGMLGAVSKKRKRSMKGVKFPTTGTIGTAGASIGDMLNSKSKDTIKEIKIDGLYPVGADDTRESEVVKTKNVGPTPKEIQQIKEKEMKNKKKSESLKSSRNKLRKRSGTRSSKMQPKASVGGKVPTTTTQTSSGMSSANTTRGTGNTGGSGGGY